MRPSLASSVELIWGKGVHIRPEFFGLSHVYLLGREALTAAQRATVCNEVQRLSARGFYEHMGISPLYDKEVAPRAARKARKAPRQFLHPDDAIATINRIAEENRNSEQMRCGLMLMYTCGLTAAVAAKLRATDFIPYDGQILLNANGSLYVLTPSVRELTVSWLAQAPVPERPFARMQRRFAAYGYLADSYNVVQSY
jgi:integrase